MNVPYPWKNYPHGFGNPSPRFVLHVDAFLEHVDEIGFLFDTFMGHVDVIDMSIVVSTPLRVIETCPPEAML
jgi:hypothetical protein